MELKHSAHAAIKNLIVGYQQFKAKYFKGLQYFDKLVREGQRPEVLVIACCDSRADPAIITHAKPGELFVVRNIANIVPPYEDDDSKEHLDTRAALEFGVLGLGVSHIIVIGHSQCGGIHALMKGTDGAKQTSFIRDWMNVATPVKKNILKKYSNESLTEQWQHCEKALLLNSFHNLNTFPWITQRVLKKKLHVHAWYFTLETGTIETYDSKSGYFITLEKL